MGLDVLRRVYYLLWLPPTTLLGARLGNAAFDRDNVLREWHRVLLLSHDGLALMGPHGRQFDALPRMGRRRVHVGRGARAP